MDKRNRLLVITVLIRLAVIACAPSLAVAQSLPLPDFLTRLDSTEGARLLREARCSADFFRLVIYFDTQQNLGYCGPASTAMVMNALGVQRPHFASYGEYTLFTQDNVFCESARRIKSPSLVAQSGLTLQQLGAFIECQGCLTQTTHASETSIGSFRSLLTAVTLDSDRFLVVNYYRKALNQESGGHISPVAAYNEKADKALVLDVAKYKYPPVWVPVTRLWSAMAALDQETSKPRGYVLAQNKVSRRSTDP